MPKAKRSDSWGFPRWGSYGSNSSAQALKMCDRHGCNEAGLCPAPKSPNSPERWYFCEAHAAEYNRGWDYFEGLDKEERAQREADERRDTSGYRESAYHEWMGPGDGSRSRDEMRALEIFDLTPDVDFDTVKKSWRKFAKEFHPDVNPGDAAAAKQFQAGQAAFDVLKAAEERRVWKPV
ncbi:MAG: J domain-containing protein [Parasphingorhabdus sp.]|nr:J domain-containing protein [Parasphingorhabdus sp.]